MICTEGQLPERVPTQSRGVQMQEQKTLRAKGSLRWLGIGWPCVGGISLSVGAGHLSEPDSEAAPPEEVYFPQLVPLFYFSS